MALIMICRSGKTNSHFPVPPQWGEDPFPAYRGALFHTKIFLPVARGYEPQLDGEFRGGFGDGRVIDRSPSKIKKTRKGTTLLVPAKNHENEILFWITSGSGFRGVARVVETRDVEEILSWSGGDRTWDGISVLYRVTGPTPRVVVQSTGRHEDYAHIFTPEGSQEVPWEEYLSQRTAQTLFVLGAPDPEMEAIEWLLKDRGLSYVYAMKDGHRVRAFEAYDADPVTLPEGVTRVVHVECQTPVPEGVETVTIDHHRPGDPGYGMPPEKSYSASSLGQVMTLLHKMDPDYYSPQTIPVQGKYWSAAVIAAADHCLTAAYHGQTNVDVADVYYYRMQIQSKFLGIRPMDWERKVAHATRAIKEAPVADEFPGTVRDLRSVYREKGPVDLANEAAAQLAVGILYEMKKGDRTQVGLIGGTPEQIRYFMETWAPAQGLDGIYGDPARGFAGGYMPADAGKEAE